MTTVDSRLRVVLVDDQDLHLAPGTIRTHINRIFTTLDLRDRVQAVILAYECGLVRHG